MRRFVVVSYDDDQQQWFYDFIFAVDADRAKERILKIRDYCQEADAIPLHELTRMARNLRKASKPQTERWLRELVPSSECQNCGKKWPDTELEPEKDIHQRVAPGEPMPNGQCPDCGAVCHSIIVHKPDCHIPHGSADCSCKP